MNDFGTRENRSTLNFFRARSAAKQRRARQEETPHQNLQCLPSVPLLLHVCVHSACNNPPTPRHFFVQNRKTATKPSEKQPFSTRTGASESTRRDASNRDGFEVDFKNSFFLFFFCLCCFGSARENRSKLNSFRVPNRIGTRKSFNFERFSRADLA